MAKKKVTKSGKVVKRASKGRKGKPGRKPQYKWETKKVLNERTHRWNTVKVKTPLRQISDVLTFKNGNIRQAKVDKFLASIDAKDRQDAIDLINRAAYNGVRMYAKTLRAKLARTKREMMVLNIGYTMEQSLKELNATEEEFFNEKNWRKGGIFVNSQGQAYKYQWGYVGSIWKKVDL